MPMPIPNVKPPGQSIFQSGYFKSAVEFFGPGLDYNSPIVDIVRLDFGRADNIVGHQQRCFNLFWGIKVCGALGKVGLDIGASGVPAPYCLALDFYQGGCHPVYEGGCDPQLVACGEDLTPHIVMEETTQTREGSGRGSKFVGKYSPWPPRSHVEAISPLCDNSFPLVVANHVPEHIQGDFAEVLDKHWLRVLEPGGYLCMVIPDHACHDVFQLDRSHVHGWTPDSFCKTVLSKVLHRMKVVEFDTFGNRFSFNAVLQKTR